MMPRGDAAIDGLAARGNATWHGGIATWQGHARRPRRPWRPRGRRSPGSAAIASHARRGYASTQP